MNTELEKLVALHKKMTADYYDNPTHNPAVWTRPAFEALYSVIAEMHRDLSMLRAELKDMKKEK
jgi:hypothetical protein